MARVTEAMSSERRHPQLVRVLEVQIWAEWYWRTVVSIAGSSGRTKCSRGASTEKLDFVAEPRGAFAALEIARAVGREVIAASAAEAATGAALGGVISAVRNRGGYRRGGDRRETGRDKRCR